MFDEKGIPFAVTIERAFGGEPVMPTGIYKCTKTVYHKGGYETFEIHVEGHSRILFHKANFFRDVEGCIGIAENFEDFNGEPGVGQSAKGFHEFWQKYGTEDEITLVIDQYVRPE